MADAFGRQDPSTPALTRIYLGQWLSLATLAPVIEHLRAALEGAEGPIELDSRDLLAITEGASMLIAREIERAQQAGHPVCMAA